MSLRPPASKTHFLVTENDAPVSSQSSNCATFNQAVTIRLELAVDWTNRFRIRVAPDPPIRINRRIFFLPL